MSIIAAITGAFSRKTPEASTSPSLLELMEAGNVSESGIAVTDKSALRISAVWACINVLSDSLAQMPIIIYRRNGSKKERIADHPLANLLRHEPNGFMSSFQFFKTAQLNRLIYGSSVNYIVRGVDGRPLELLPIPPEQIKAKQKDDWSIEYTWSPPGKQKRVLTRDQIFIVPWITFNGYECLSPIEYHRQSLGVALASQRHLSASYKNGMKAHGGLHHPGKLSKEAKDLLSASYDAGSSGVNAYRTPVFEEGLEWKPMSITPKDAQYIETMQFEVEDIARIFKVSPHKIGHLLRATFSNIEHLGIEFVVDTMMPHVVAWEQEINRQLIPINERESVFAEFLVDGLLRGDSAARANFYSTMLDRAVMSANEVRERENMNPYEGGDIYQRAGNLSAPAQTNTGGNNAA